jgi:hypothetical protein
LDELLTAPLVDHLRELHQREALVDNNLTLRDIPRLYDSVMRGDTPFNESLDREVDELAPPTREVSAAAINPANILPEGTRRRRTVRFQLPALR